MEKIPIIKGILPFQYINFTVSDYMRAAVSTIYYSNMTNRQKSPWSQEFAKNKMFSNNTRVSYYESIADGEYGAHMIFAMDPNRSNFKSILLPNLTDAAKYLKNDNLIFDGVVYPADHK